MKLEIDQNFSNINIKAEIGNSTIARTAIVTEEEFYNAHGYIFESDLKIEGTKLHVQDYAIQPLSIEPPIEVHCHGNESDNFEVACPKKVVVELKKLSNRMLRRFLCPKKVVPKVKKLSVDMLNKYSAESRQKSTSAFRGFECDICQKKFQYKATLSKHMEVHSGRIPCSVLSKGHRSKIPLKHHQPVHMTAKRNYSCNICSNSFSHSDALKHHLQEHLGLKSVHKKKWVCQFCQIKFYTSQELMTHRKTHTELSFYQCKMCPMSFINKGHFQGHTRDHNRNSNIERPFECYMCKQKFILIHFLKNHMRIHTKRYDCRICTKIFNQEELLNMHMLTHSGKYRFECSECQKGFNWHTSLVRHVRIHTNEKPFECEHCHKTFREKDYLVAHMRTHTADKTIDYTKYTWRYSNEKKFRQSKTNSRSGTDETKKCVAKVYKCKICFKILKNEKDLNSHFEGHSGKYLFECQECSQGFDYRPNLYRHMRKHTGEKPYKCDLCPRKYGDIASFKVHKRCHAGEKVECDICLQKISDKGYLKIHKRLHTGEKPFECPQCKDKFRAKQSLSLHKCVKCNKCCCYFSKMNLKKHTC